VFVYFVPGFHGLLVCRARREICRQLLVESLDTECDRSMPLVEADSMDQIEEKWRMIDALCVSSCFASARTAMCWF
jgi:hypothetical protein